MSLLTLPTNPLSYTITGDIDVLNAINADNGDGTIYIRNGGLYVNGLSDLNQTTIDTTTGTFAVIGTGLVSVNVTNSIQMTAAGSSYLTTSSGTMTLSATDTTTGKVTISAAGDGANSVLISATNTTDGQITISSAGGSTSVNPVKILATDATNGNIYIEASGNYAATNPAIYLNASNTTSGQVKIVGANNIDSINAILLSAPGTTGGNISIEAAGTSATFPSIQLYASNATDGTIDITSNGPGISAINILASNVTSGGVNINATGGPVNIETQNTGTGITIATTNPGVPVSIGTSTSITTINGDLIVSGTRTEVNTVSMTVNDNVIVVNSGNTGDGADGGVLIHRYQNPNASTLGDVVTATPGPIQESGAFQAGSATPATLVLDAFTSSTTDFYKGWWIVVTSGTGSGQVRRIKSYNGTTKTATIYVTSDNNNTGESPFTDGLNLVTAPAAADTYKLYSASYVASVYDTSNASYSLITTALAPIALNLGTSVAQIQQYQDTATGGATIHTKIYDNAFGSASSTTITFTLQTHGLITGDQVYISNSANFTPSITSAVYTVTVLSANTFTITVGSSTTSAANSSATIEILKSSYIKVNSIQPYTSSIPISIPGISEYQDIAIPYNSTSLFSLNLVTSTYGCFFILVGDINNTDGAMATFSVSSAGTGGSVSRLSVSKGTEGQRIQATWTTGNDVQIFHQPAASTNAQGAILTYRCKVFSLF